MGSESEHSNGFTAVNMPVRMPSPRSKSAPRFDGRNLSEFLTEFELNAKAALLSEEEKASIILNYVTKRVRRTLEDLKEFKKADWKLILTRLKRLYSSADQQYTPSLLAFRGFVKKKRRITKRAHLDKYTADFMRKSNKLIEMSRLTSAERDRSYYLGLPESLREKIRARIQEKGKSQEHPLGFTKANPPSMDIVMEEAEKEYQNDAFDAPSESESEESGSDFYSEDEDTDSDEESSGGDRGNKERRGSRSKAEGGGVAKAEVKVSIPKDSKTLVEVKEPPSPIDELTQLVKDLKLEMATIKTNQAVDRLRDGRTYRCFMCDGTIEHGGGFKRCPETAKLLEESLIKYASDGRLVLINGQDLPRVPPGKGGVANIIRDIKARLSGAKAGRALCADLYLNGEPALTGDSYAISCEDYEVAAAERAKKRIQTAKEDADEKVMRSGKRLKFSHVEAPKRHDSAKSSATRSNAIPIDPARDKRREVVEEVEVETEKRRKIVEVVDEADKENASARDFGGKEPPKENLRDAYKERTMKNKAVKDDIIMKDDTRNKSRAGGTSSFRYTSDLREDTSVPQIAEKILDTHVTLPLKMVLAGSSDLQKEIFNKAKMRREYVGAMRMIGLDSDSDDSDDSDEGVVNVRRASVRELVEKHSYGIMVSQPKFYAVGTGKVEGKINGEKATFLVDCGSELNLMPLRVQQCLQLPIDPDGSRWSLRGIAEQRVPLVGCCRDMSLEIGGHRFDHHLFVSSEDHRFDAILGQPWLTWVSAAINYSGRDGSMSITVFVNGDTKGPRVIIPAVRTGPKNQASLVFSGECEPSSRVAEYSYKKAGTEAIPSVYAGKLVEKVPALGSRLEYLCGSKDRHYMPDEQAHILEIAEGVGEEYDELLRTVDKTVYRPSSRARVLQKCEWVHRALGTSYRGEERTYWSRKTRYKPVKDRVHPVQAPLPDPRAEIYKEIVIPEQEPLPVVPPRIEDYSFAGRITRDRLEYLLAQMAGNFLSTEEVLEVVYVLMRNQNAIAFTDEERGTFSREYYPDHVIPTIPHTPWCDRMFKLPKVEEETIMKLVSAQRKAGKFEPSSGPYRSAVFTVKKKDGSARLVHDMRSLNAVTIRDAALPPRVEDFAEGFVGRQIYMVADLFSGYDARVLAEESRDLTAFHTPRGSAMRLTSVPQGYTNAMQVFQRSTFHALGPEVPDFADVFVDDCGVKGPRSDYDNETIPGNEKIRRFVYEFLTTVNRILTRFRYAGVTVSGWKLVAATPVIKIVGSVCSANGWHLEKGLVSKIQNWPECRSATEVRGFLGTAGVGRKWIKGFSLIAKPLTKLTRNVPFEWGVEEAEAMQRIKKLVVKAPVLKVLDYEAAKKEFVDIREINEVGVVIVAVDSSIYGAGWILYQIFDDGRHPILFGSCTFSETESRYSQPKLELYGCYRALSSLKHRVWGLKFRLEMDAKFVKEMIEKPDLPNAPMTRWVSYLKLFDFEIKHIPADRHKAADGLSRRMRADVDSDDEDPEVELMKYVGDIVMEDGEVPDRWGRVWWDCLRLEYEKINMPVMFRGLVNDERSKRIDEQWMNGQSYLSNQSIKELL